MLEYQSEIIKSLGVLEIFFFENISGLKINFQKTKMVWIGSKKISSEVFHHTRWKLDWNNSYFDILGVKFSINLTEMIDLNNNKISNNSKIKPFNTQLTKSEPRIFINFRK